MPQNTPPSPNFGFLTRCDIGLAIVAARAEQYFPNDPVTALMKLRQFGELVAQQIAARTGVFHAVEESQTRLRCEGVIPRDVLDLFHDLRRRGNDATHGHIGDHAEAMAALRLARQLAIFFHRTFGDPKFKPVLNAAES